MGMALVCADAALALLALFGRGVPFRLALLQMAVAFGLFVVTATEALSACRAINPAGVLSVWIGAGAMLAILARDSIATGARSALDAIRRARAADAGDRLLCAGAGSITGLVVLTAVVCPPNTWDAMEYHLPRVAMWMTNHSVELFPTPDYRQVVLAPWSEFAMLHFCVLAGSDRFVNLVQATCFIGCAIAASWIARELGAGARGQVLASVVSASVAEGVLEASGAMNTCAVTFWVTTALAFLIGWVRGAGRLNLLAFAVSTALACLTKGTAYVWLPLLVAGALLVGGWKSALRFLAWSPAIGAVILGIWLPQAMRAYRLTGSPLGVPFADGGPVLHVTVDRISPGGVAANVLRNLSLHVGTPSLSVNALLERGVRWTIRAIGQDPDDPMTTWPGRRFRINRFSRHEAYAGNGVHLLLIGIAIAWLLARRRTQRSALCYTLGTVAAFVMFSALLRWQEWNSRFSLTLFIVTAAPVAILLEQAWHAAHGLALGLLLVAHGLFFATQNEIRGLIPRRSTWIFAHSRAELSAADQHLAAVPQWVALADAVNSQPCNVTAIDAYMPVRDRDLIRSPPSYFVYPILALIHAYERHHVRYAGVGNMTAAFAGSVPTEPACALICLSCASAPEKWRQYGRHGAEGAVFGDDVLFTGWSSR